MCRCYILLMTKMCKVQKFIHLCVHISVCVTVCLCVYVYVCAGGWVQLVLLLLSYRRCPLLCIYIFPCTQSILCSSVDSVILFRNQGIGILYLPFQYHGLRFISYLSLSTSILLISFHISHCVLSRRHCIQ